MYSNRTGTLLVSTYHGRKGRGIAGRGITVKKRSIHIEDTMRPGQMLPTPIGSMPEILQPTCMLEQKVRSAGEDIPWGGADQRKCHSQILCQSMCWRTAAMSPMILWHMTWRHLVI